METKVVTNPSDDKPKKNKKVLPTQYGIYSGIINDKGKTVENPTVDEAIKNMVRYSKNNRPPESDEPSNVYRDKMIHSVMVYNRKKKQNSA